MRAKPMNLKTHTPLQRAPDLTIELRAGNDVELTLDGETFPGHQLTLAVLDTFSSRKTLRQGLDELLARIEGTWAWIDLVEHVSALARQGILQSSDRRQPVLRSDPGVFDGAPVHIRMLNDRARTAGYQKAIRETVTPDDVVVDVGTGTGILAVTAARAGAKHVYAIESSGMGRLARRAFAANRLSDRITLIEGSSIHVDLPEKADVLVSEIIGNDPLCEGILETTADAVERLLKPGARLIPESLHIYGLPVAVPLERLQEYIFTDESAAQWQAWYDMDFSPLTAAARRQNHSLFASTYETRNWPRLSEPVLLAELDLRSSHYEKIKASAEVRASRSGELNGIVVFFETRLSPSVHFSIHPSEASPRNSWASKVWIAGQPVPLTAGDTFDLTYTFGKKGSLFEIDAAAAR